MPRYFLGVVLPKAEKGPSASSLSEYTDFTADETLGLKLERDLPLIFEHDESRKIGRVLSSFDFATGEKGVLGVVDDSPRGREYARLNMDVAGGALGLSLGHAQRKIAKKAGELNETGDKRFERDGHSITKRPYHLAVVKEPGRSGCRILTWFGGEGYKGEGAEKFLKALATNSSPRFIEKMSSDSTKKMQDEYAELEKMEKDQLIKFAAHMKKKADKAHEEREKIKKEFEPEIERAKKSAEENSYLKELMKEAFMTTVQKNLSQFSKITGQSEEDAKAMSDNFNKGLNPWSPAEGEGQINRPTFAQNFVETMVEASAGKIAELEKRLAHAENRPLVESDAPTKRRRTDEQAAPPPPTPNTLVEEMRRFLS